jgi:hypothetical protein
MFDTPSVVGHAAPSACRDEATVLAPVVRGASVVDSKRLIGNNEVAANHETPILVFCRQVRWEEGELSLYSWMQLR